MEAVWRMLEVKRQREQVTRLTVALENSPGELYMFDEHSLRFEHASGGALRNLGYSLEELKGLTVRSNNCGSNGLKSRPGSCPFTPVVQGSGV